MSNRNTFPDLIVSNFQHILSPWQIFVITFSTNGIFGFRGQDERTKSFVRHVLILFCSLCSLLWDLEITYWINIRFYITVTVVSLLWVNYNQSRIDPLIRWFRHPNCTKCKNTKVKDRNKSPCQTEALSISSNFHYYILLQIKIQHEKLSLEIFKDWFKIFLA